MPYGQIHYGDMQGGGNGGKPAAYTISQIGCFVTAFCNLEERFGNVVAPNTLNQIFTSRGIYIDVDDGVKDDLGWESITAYDGQIKVSGLGSGWPPSNNAIVKFAYTSPNSGRPTTHFCLVADHDHGTIVDSWDGLVKAPGIYGQPVAYATYDHVVPEPVHAAVSSPMVTSEQLNELYNALLGRNPDQAGIDHYVDHYSYDFVKNDIINSAEYAKRNTVVPPQPPSAPIAYTPTEKYQVVTTIPGFGTSVNAYADVNALQTIAPGEYPIYSRDTDKGQVQLLIDASSNPKLLLWVNPNQNREVKNDIPVSKPDPTPIVVSTPVVPPPPSVNANAWKTTQSAFYLNRDPEVFTSRNLSPIQIFDLDGKHDPISLPAHKDDVRIVATFEKDGVLYGRPESCFKPNSQFYGSWYGVPMSILDYDSVTTTAERLALGTGRFKDKLLYEVSKGVKLIEDIKKKRSK